MSVASSGDQPCLTVRRTSWSTGQHQFRPSEKGSRKVALSRECVIDSGLEYDGWD
jgi:hypothetical protein